MRPHLQVLGLFFKGLWHGLRRRMSGFSPEWTAAILETLRSVMEAYGRGDYETALRAADGFAALRNQTSYCFYRGSMLMHLGRLQEAEPFQRCAVALQRDRRRTALAYSVLGQNLEEQRRYDEAMQCFGRALRRSPGKGSVHRHMAELHLVRGGAPGEALDLATLAVKEERALSSPRPEMQRVHKLNLGEALATLAWAAAAASGDRAEVDSLVAEAVPLMTGGDSNPTCAQVQYHAGQAYAALGDTAKSAEHFETAARLDPNGIWGRAAGSAANRTRR